jgi:hypothetical protein
LVTSSFDPLPAQGTVRAATEFRHLSCQHRPGWFGSCRLHRRIAFIVFAQRIGLTLEETVTELARLPLKDAPSREDWSSLSGTWASRIDERPRTELICKCRQRFPLRKCLQAQWLRQPGRDVNSWAHFSPPYSLLAIGWLLRLLSPSQPSQQPSATFT